MAGVFQSAGLANFDSLRQSDYDASDAICQRPIPLRSLMWRSFIAVSVGGMLGCLLRWCLAIFLNRYFPTIPPGTLAANLIGCYIIGMAIAFFTAYPTFAPEWRLFLTTGFCGGLTTFSTFSAEIVLLLQSGRALSALGAVAAHVVGSLVMTFAGIATVMWVKN
jgi:CrcB protein